MTAELINLRRARKQRARAGKEARAAENRTAFGRGKDEKALASSIRALEERRHASGRRQKRSAADGDE